MTTAGIPDSPIIDDRPGIHCTPEQLENFTAHVGGCDQCRIIVVSGWSLSVNVTETLPDLCIEGVLLLGATELEQGVPS